MTVYPDRATFGRMYMKLTKMPTQNIDKIATGLVQLTLPLFPVGELVDLCNVCTEYFRREPIMLEVSSPVYVFGDLHGHFLDFVRQMQKISFPLTHKIIFLGDLVDRGEFSLETVTAVFALKAWYPEDIYIVRGNHEFDYLCNKCGFLSEIIEKYNDAKAYTAFLTAFSFMPLATRIDRTILTLHGGIGPQFEKLSQLCAIQRPILDFGADIVDSILWSDPQSVVSLFEPSSRGSGYFFGEEALKQFCETNSIKKLIRAHECVMDGIKIDFSERLVTVFGASNYCGIVENKSALLYIGPRGEMKWIQFPPLAYLRKQSVKMLSTGCKEKKMEGKSGMNERSLSSASFPSLVRPGFASPPPKTGRSKLSRSASNSSSLSLTCPNFTRPSVLSLRE